MHRIVSAARQWIILATLTAGTAIAATAVVLPSSSEAAPGSNCTYYSDANHTTIVGRFGTDCCNNKIAWGEKTPYAECGAVCLPCFPPPRD
jgi:hypothetical protein